MAGTYGRKGLAGNGWQEDMAGRGWQETGGGNMRRESVGGKILRGKRCLKIFFSMSKTGNGCTVFISQNIKKNSFRPNISKRMERDSMAGDIGGKSCS